MKYLINGLFVAIGFAIMCLGVEFFNNNLWVVLAGLIVVLLAMQSTYNNLVERYDSIIKTMQTEALTRQWYITTFPANFANGQLSCSNCSSLAIVEVALPMRNRHYCKKCHHTLFYTPLNQG